MRRYRSTGFASRRRIDREASRPMTGSPCASVTSAIRCRPVPGPGSCGSRARCTSSTSRARSARSPSCGEPNLPDPGRIDAVPDSDDMAARSRQLAKDSLDEMDKPKSPEREAAEAQKEREDREALERFYIATGQLTPEKVCLRALHELADAIERIDPKSTFEPIEIPVTMANRRGVLRFAPSPSKADKRYVELSISSESGLSTS